MSDLILALNAGSSSIKFSLFVITGRGDALSLVYQGQVEGLGSEPHFLVSDSTGKGLVDEQLRAKTATTLSHEEALGVLLEWIAHHEKGLTLIAVGHRIVHGGRQFLAPVLVDSVVINQLEQLVPLAPLHQPHNLAAIRSIARMKPDIPQ